MSCPVGFEPLTHGCWMLGNESHHNVEKRNIYIITKQIFFTIEAQQVVKKPDRVTHTDINSQQ